MQGMLAYQALALIRLIHRRLRVAVRRVRTAWVIIVCLIPTQLNAGPLILRVQAVLVLAQAIRPLRLGPRLHLARQANGGIMEPTPVNQAPLQPTLRRLLVLRVSGGIML